MLLVVSLTMKNVSPALYSAKPLQSRLENKINLSVAEPGFFLVIDLCSNFALITYRLQRMFLHSPPKE